MGTATKQHRRQLTRSSRRILLLPTMNQSIKKRPAREQPRKINIDRNG